MTHIIRNNDSGIILDEDVLEQINTWCGVHGLMYSDGGVKWNAAPLSLTPLPYPTNAFQFVQEIQPVWNFLMDRIARNRPFLSVALESVAASDPEFTGQLFRLYSALPEMTVASSWSLGIFRSDYMLHETGSCEQSASWRPLQVEINTIASGLGCLTTKSNQFLQEFLVRQAWHPQLHQIFSQQENYSHSQGSIGQCIRDIAAHIQISPSLQRVAVALAQAHNCYLRVLHQESDSEYSEIIENGTTVEAVDVNNRVRILFVVQPRERNVGDQRALEQELWQAHGIRCEFATFSELQPPQLTLVSSHSKKNSPPKLVFQRCSSRSPTKGYASNKYEISVVYFRAGYTPTDYDESIVDADPKASVVPALPSPSQDLEQNDHMRAFHRAYADMHGPSWRVRCLIEFSRAIKCPSVGLHLAGCKAVQTALTRPGVVESLLQDYQHFQSLPAGDTPASVLRKCFAEQYLLSELGESASAAVADACATEGKQWVLKPQREGGGNNLYGPRLAQFLHNHRDDDKLQGYVLMRRFQPPVQSRTVFYKFGEVTSGPAISELGIFGSYLGNGKNHCSGHEVGYCDDSNLAADDSDGEVSSQTGEIEINGGYVGYLLRTKGAEVDEGGVATGFSVLNSLYLT